VAPYIKQQPQAFVALSDFGSDAMPIETNASGSLVDLRFNAPNCDILRGTSQSLFCIQWGKGLDHAGDNEESDGISCTPYQTI